MSENLNKIHVSVIIPLWVDSERFYQDLIKFNEIQSVEYELLVVYDNGKRIPEGIEKNVTNLRLVPTKQSSTGPAEKRDLASKLALGRYLAFIDDDAYPDKDWIKEILTGFNHKDIVAVGGPGITPPEASFLEKVSGKVYESYLCSGLAQNRFVRKEETFVIDWPAYNLVVRKEIFDQVGGFDVKFYGGEDTFLCMKLLSLGKIRYLPNAFVYHHRRPVFMSLFRQIYNIGKHRGYFFKKFPKNSRKFFYTLPSILTLGLLSLILLSLFSVYFFLTLAFLLLLSFIIALVTISNEKSLSFIKNLRLRILASIGIIGVHVSYGISFIEGLLTKNLER